MLYAIGYETRSRFIADHSIAPSEDSLAIEYSSNRTLSFQVNKEQAERKKHLIVSDEGSALDTTVSAFLDRQLDMGRPIVLGVDVSAMNRSIMATVLLAACERLRSGDRLVILYSPAKFRKPSLDLLPLRTFGPVHPDLTGALGDPSRNRSIVIGLGYEYGVSLNVLDSHEPDMSFVFRPVGFDPRFLESMEEANFGFDFGERNYEVIDYNLDDIPRLVGTLDGLFLSAKHSTNITCVPFGPKIFSAACIFTAALHRPDVSVLRYSLSDLVDPNDVEADGSIVGCEIEFLNQKPRLPQHDHSDQ
ncbi:hypothetical protein [Nitratireductor thuwali]|uniref:hypothetical protein n=1 Tax=Nitratireductor thuwali TaxID=2267699 RepID=UPI0030D288D8